MRRNAVLLILSALLLTSACVQLPQPITETSPAVVPAWTIDQAETRRAEIIDAVDSAARTGAQGNAYDVVADTDLSTVIAGWSNHEKYGDAPPTDDWRRGKVTHVWSSSGVSYPQTALVRVKLATTVKGTGATQLIEVYTREAVTSDWLRSATALASGSLVWPGTGTFIKAPPKRLNGLGTERVPEFIAALNNPMSKRAEGFTKNTALNYNVKARARLAKDTSLAQATATSSTAGRTWGLATPNGAFLVVPTTYTEQWKYKMGTTYSWQKGSGLERYWKGEDYTGATFSDLVVYAVQVPTTGKITVAGEYRTNMSITSY